MAKLKTMTVKIMDNGIEKELTVAMVGPGGHPLYEIDGKEVEQDIDDLRGIIKTTNEENAQRRIENKELKAKIEVIGDLDVEKAREALGIVANLDMKKLVDAKEMDKVKEQIEAAWKTNMENQKTAYETQITELKGSLTTEQTKMKNMMIKNAFLGSEFLKGTVYDIFRDDAYKLYGDRFDVEAGDNGDMRVSFKNQDGSQFLSTARPGQPGSFDEAIEHIITNHPQKEYLMKGSQASGSGAHGGGGGGTKTTLQQLQDAYAVAEKNKDTQQMMILKDQIHAARTGAGA